RHRDEPGRDRARGPAERREEEQRRVSELYASVRPLGGYEQGYAREPGDERQGEAERGAPIARKPPGEKRDVERDRRQEERRDTGGRGLLRVGENTVAADEEERPDDRGAGPLAATRPGAAAFAGEPEREQDRSADETARGHHREGRDRLDGP